MIIGGTVLFLVLRAARFPLRWPTHLRAGSVMLVILLMTGLLISIPATVLGRSIGALLFVVVFVAPFVLLITLSRRARVRWSLPTLLFLVVTMLVPLCYIVDPAWHKIAASGIVVPGGGLFTSIYFPDGAILLAAVLSIVITVWDLRAKKSTYQTVEHLRALFVLSASVLGVYWLGSSVYQRAITTGESFRPALAVVVLVALTWDILVSGHPITNVNGILFPRRSRVLLYFGYISLATTTVLFWVSLKFPPLEEVSATLSNLEGFVQAGLALIAPPFLVTLFILRLGRSFACDPDIFRLPHVVARPMTDGTDS